MTLVGHVGDSKVGMGRKKQNGIFFAVGGSCCSILANMLQILANMLQILVKKLPPKGGGKEFKFLQSQC